MDLAKKALFGASWLAFFKFFSQVYSWVITIKVARILLPDDYALMTMSTILTGYAMMFSNLGLGSAIVYRKDSTQQELSSVFWFSVVWGLGFSILAVILAYPTAAIFHENKLIPLTQAVSVLFILNSVLIVPVSIQNRDFQFKHIGLIEMIATFISSSIMLLMAHTGAGVWTLLIGSIIMSFIRMVLSFSFTKWLPKLHFSFAETKKFLSFGILTSVGTSLSYIYERSDRFFAGRAWSRTDLGFYEMALDLAQMPVTKITSIINQVSFPVFSHLQNDQKRFNDFYLTILKLMCIAVCPFFIGGYLLGDDLIRVILNEKWFPIIPTFKMMCLVQVFTVIATINNFVHAAQGRPHWFLVYNAFLAVLMATSFALTIKLGIKFIWISWLSTYIIISVCWTYFTLRKIGLSFTSYLRIVIKALFLIGIMAFFIILVRFQIKTFNLTILNQLLIQIISGITIYGSCLFFFEKKFFSELLVHLKKG